MGELFTSIAQVHKPMQEKDQIFLTTSHLMESDGHPDMLTLLVGWLACSQLWQL